MKEILIIILLFSPACLPAQVQQYIYAAEDQGWIYVYDINNNHQLVKKIEVPGTGEYKGISADAKRGKIYLSSYTNDQLVCVDMYTEKIDWAIPIVGYPDSHAQTPDGKYIYIPKRHGKSWDVVDTDKKRIVATIPIPYGNPHNTWCSKNGNTMYLAALGNEYLYVADVKKHKIKNQIGPFIPNPADPWGWTQKKKGPKGIRPFALSHDEKECYVNLDGILGYEIGDLHTGVRKGRIEVKGYESLRGSHLTTSHGINLPPHKNEIWVSNDAGPYIHIFDAAQTPHRQIADIKLSGKNGWISFSIDGSYGYASSGDVIDVSTRNIVAKLIVSEKLLEIQFENGKAIKTGTR